AGGITEVIACIKAMQTGLLPPNINYDQPDPECQLNIVANEAREAGIFCAMSNSLGFGGQNSSVVVARRPGCR
ncbi:MAG: beta-ketoacyl-[Desulfovibrio sp.]|nr:beta-ketoacyl-[acyl-carrier-protein] synthase II [Desulfovibrio sp.]